MAKAKVQTADAPTSGELENNKQLITRIEQALITDGHKPQRMESVIHHIDDRFTNLWVMPVMRNTKVVVGQFILRIGSRDIIREMADPHTATLDDIVDWIEDWMKTTTEPVVEPTTTEETEGDLFDDNGAEVES